MKKKPLKTALCGGIMSCSVCNTPPPFSSSSRKPWPYSLPHTYTRTAGGSCLRMVLRGNMRRSCPPAFLPCKRYACSRQASLHDGRMSYIRTCFGACYLPYKNKKQNRKRLYKPCTRHAYRKGCLRYDKLLYIRKRNLSPYLAYGNLYGKASGNAASFGACTPALFRFI